MTTVKKYPAKQGKKQPKGEYEIGYGKPPKKYQWKPGQSGNPEGYKPPKSKKQLEALIDELFAEKVTYKKRKMPRIRALLLALMDSGVPGKKEVIERRYGRIPNTVDVTIPTIFTQINLDSLPIEILDKIARGDISVLSDLIGNRSIAGELVEGDVTEVEDEDGHEAED